MHPIQTLITDLQEQLKKGATHFYLIGEDYDARLQTIQYTEEESESDYNDRLERERQYRGDKAARIKKQELQLFNKELADYHRLKNKFEPHKTK